MSFITQLPIIKSGHDATLVPPVLILSAEDLLCGHYNQCDYWTHRPALL